MQNKPDYSAPRTLEEALQVLGETPEGARVLAGGTDLVPRMRARMVTPSLLVDLRLLALDEINLDGDWLALGACVTQTALIELDLIASHFPTLAEAAREMAGPPIRNRATIGGNLVNASPAADLAPPLLVYDAEVVLAKTGSVRRVPLSEFFTGPGQTVLAPEELLATVRLPLMPPSTAAKFIKLGKRKAMAVAVVDAAARLSLDANGRISQARIALGSVAPTPMRAVGAEALLVGQSPSEELFAEAGQTASEAASPISDLRASAGYRKQMVAVLSRRALMGAWLRLQEARI